MWKDMTKHAVDKDVFAENFAYLEMSGLSFISGLIFLLHPNSVAPPADVGRRQTLETAGRTDRSALGITTKALMSPLGRAPDYYEGA